MTRKKLWLIGILLLFIVFTVGCSGAKQVSEEQIKNDILLSAPDLNDDMVIEDFKITDRYLNEEDRTEQIFIELDGKSDTTYFFRSYYSEYYFSDKGGWILSDINASNKAEWKTTALKGPDEKLANEAFFNESVYFGSAWHDITEENLKKVEVTSSDIELDENKAVFHCTLTLETDLFEVSGNADAILRFDEEYVENNSDIIAKDGWYLDYTMIEEDDYTFNYKEDIAPDVTADTIKYNLDGASYLFYDGRWVSQQIFLAKDKISDITFDDTYIYNNGYSCTYNGDFTYTTPTVTFEGEYSMDANYDTYDECWYYDEVQFELDTESVHLPEEWIGTYNMGETAIEIKFTSISEDGSLEADCSIYPMPRMESGSRGSYKANGSYNFETLEISINFSEWIEEPEGINYVNIYGYIAVDSSSIIGDSNEIHIVTKESAERMAETPAIHDELNYLDDEELNAFSAAIDTIYNEYGVGTLLLLTSADEDTWDYLCAKAYDYSYKYSYTECSVLCINPGSFYETYQQGYFGEKLSGCEMPDEFYDHILVGDYAKIIELYLTSVYTYLGGNADDLGFTE